MITGAYYLEETAPCSPLEANWLSMKCLRNFSCKVYLCLLFPPVHPVWPQGFHLVNGTNNTIFTGSQWLELSAEEWETLWRQKQPKKHINVQLSWTGNNPPVEHRKHLIFPLAIQTTLCCWWSIPVVRKWVRKEDSSFLETNHDVMVMKRDFYSGRRKIPVVCNLCPPDRMNTGIFWVWACFAGHEGCAWGGRWDWGRTAWPVGGAEKSIQRSLPQWQIN